MSNLMYKRKLHSLNYPEIDTFNIESELCFKQLIYWLEDQKIRHYKIEDRQALKDLNSSNWNDSYIQYLNDICCPVDSNDYVLVADWCLTFAIRLIFEDLISEDDSNVLKEELIKKLSHNKSNDQKTNPLDNLDFESNEFKECVKQLANHLKIPVHPDHLVTLKACLIYIQNRLVGSENEQNSNKDKNSIFKLDEIPSGIEIDNKELKDALKLMRLLYINNLRDLQTSINQILVNVQSITANPQTDTSLGRVGR